ncbi:MAG: hypothetical protein ABIR71_12045 [Chthoniobacterales bacterium]
MSRNLIGCCGLLLAVGLACQPAAAGDRKSAKRGNEEVAEFSAGTKVNAFSQRSELLGTRVFEARKSTASTQVSGRRAEPHTDVPARVRKELTFFRFRSTIGEVAVQPVVGQVNGAQFSLGF